MIKEEHKKEDILNLMDQVSDSGYKSILLPFQPEKNEPISLANFLANRYNNISFMIAIRPYTITPVHLAMACRTFYDMYGSKLIINLVPGSKDSEEILFTNKKTNIYERKISIRNYILDVCSFLKDSEIPEFALTGYSDETLFTLKNYADISINLISDFMNNKEKIISNNKKNMVRVSIDLDNEKGIYDESCIKQENNSFFGNSQYVIEKINDLKIHGVTDLLISNTYENNKSTAIHSLIKTIS